MSYNCQIIEREEQPVLSIRTHAAVQDISNVLGRAYGAIAHYLEELGESPSGAPFAGYYNMDMQNLDLEMQPKLGRDAGMTAILTHTFF